MSWQYAPQCFLLQDSLISACVNKKLVDRIFQPISVLCWSCEQHELLFPVFSQRQQFANGKSEAWEDIRIYADLWVLVFAENMFEIASRSLEEHRHRSKNANQFLGYTDHEIGVPSWARCHQPWVIRHGSMTDIYGLSVDLHWCSMHIHGLPIDMHGFSLDIHGYPMIMDIHAWPIMGIHGYPSITIYFIGERQLIQLWFS